MDKFKDRITYFFICLFIAVVPVHALIQYHIVDDSIANRIIAGMIGLILYLLVR